MRSFQRRHSPNRQRGAFSVVAGMTLLVALACLVLVVDSGRLYLEQRRLQKLADTAALESITRLESGNCSLAPEDAQRFATENAQQRNGFLSDTENGRQSLTVACVGVTSVNDLRSTVPANDGRAVEVTTRHRVPSSILLRGANLFDTSIPAEVDLQAVAVAERETPGAAFSVGSQLLRLNNKLLGTLLKAVGLDPRLLTALDSAGLVNASVTPAGLLQALGVDVGIEQLKALSPSGLVELSETEVGLLGLDELLELSLGLVSDAALRAELAALRDAVAANVLLRDVQLHLFRTATHPGLLALSTDEVGSALDARVNLEQLLSAALMIGLHEEGRALRLNDVGVVGLATVEAGVVEPPSIGIGPIGTTTFNAQVRLLVDVNTSGGYVLGPLLDLLGTQIHLPVIVDLVDATGTLTDVDCQASPPEATIAVQSRIGSMCIGRMSADTLWSTRGSCTDAVESETLIRLLGTSLLHGKVALPVLSEDDALTLTVGETDSTTVNSLNVGSLVDDLLDELLELLATSESVPESFNAEQATAIADRYLSLPELAPSASGGNYTLSDLHRIQDRLKDDHMDWDRPRLLDLLTQPMHAEWRSKTENSCLQGGSYRKDCVRSTLIASLQTKAQGGLLGGLLETLLGSVVQPLLKTVLNPLTEVLEPILDAVGDLLTDLLAGTLGLELGRTDVELHAVSCGIPRLVR